MGDLSKHFGRSEFACKCGCGTMSVSPALLEKLDRIRDTLGCPLTVISGCRCRTHNAAEGGKPQSAHITTTWTPGRAADIAMVDDKVRSDFLRLALQEFQRVGVAKTFVHVDVADDLPAPRVWVY